MSKPVQPVIRCVLLLGTVAAAPAHAAFGPYEHGSGIKSLGFGGVSYVAAEEATAATANPASMIGLGKRYDVGLDVLSIVSEAQVTNNAAGPNQDSKANGRQYYFIPQGGMTLPLSGPWTAGFSLSSAGIGPDYPDSPYQRFSMTPATPLRSSLSLAVSGVSLMLARPVHEQQNLGVALNLNAQQLNLKGIGPFAGASQSPDHVSDQGRDTAFGIGFTVGWQGKLAPNWSGGASYRSKTWASRFHDYKGVIPDQGRLELPASYGAGLAFTPTPQWTLAAEVQRIEFSHQTALGNGIEQLAQGKLLGSSDGPGFGWNSQNIYKLGLSWQFNPRLMLRAGYSHGTEVVRPSQTLLAVLAPVTGQTHYTLGSTFSVDKRWEVSGYIAIEKNRTVDGQNSIPANFGGGEVNVSNKMFLFGFSAGRRFGL